MKLTRVQKKEKAKELAKVLKDSTHLYFTKYQGLKFKEMDELRCTLKPLGDTYKVIKNSVLGHALKEAGVDFGDVKILEGPNALLYGAGDDPVSPAKALYKFGKDKEALKILGGVVDGKWMEASKLRALSRLGTKPEVLTQLAGVLYASVAQSAQVLAAPIRDLVLVLKALEDKRQGE